MSFKTIKSPRTFLAVIYDETYTVDSGKCWALSLIDAADEKEAAAILAHAGKEIMYGKDCEFLRLPTAFLAPLAHIRRAVPIGDPDPAAEEIQSVIGDWLAERMSARRRNRSQDLVERRTVVAPIEGGAIVVNLTEDETQQMLANERAEKNEKVH